MRKFALAITFLFMALGLFLMVKPELMFDMMNSLNMSWLYLGALMRIAYGVTLIGASKDSRFPFGLGVFGVLLICGGIMFPIIGIESARDIVDAIYGENVALLRVGLTLSLGFFLFILYALNPPREDSEVAGSPES